MTEEIRTCLWRGPSILVLTALLAATPGCSEGERSIEYDGFVLTEQPSEAPRVFPPGFVYPDARPLMSGVYTRSPYASTREGVLVFESKDPINQIQAFYLRKFEQMGWQIIQSQEKSGEVFLLAENLSRRLFTVILRHAVASESFEAKNEAPIADGADEPLAPIARAEPENASTDTAEIVQIKLYIKQAGLR